MSLTLSHEVLRLPLRDPFVIARAEHGAGRSVTTVVVELRDSRRPDVVGLGEGFPDRYYGETPETMAAVLPLLVDAVGEPDLSAAGLEAAGAAMDRAIGGHGAAKCALDVALHDLAATVAGLAAGAAAMDSTIGGHGAAKCALDVALHDLAATVAGLPLHAFLGLPAAIPPTDFTLGLDDPAVVAERARRAAHFPALKIKVGGPADLPTLEAVRAVYDGPLRVDANTGWTPDVARALLPDLARLGVELIEQPFPARRLDWLRDLQTASPLPIVADESAVRIEDLDALVGVVAGVNVKLAKCGGVGPAKRMLDRARELGFRTFLGCMEETSVAIAASAAVASLAEWVDLDGNLLIADDPFAGLELAQDCRWRPSGRPGLGLVRRSV